MIGHTKLLDTLRRLVKRSPADATHLCAQAHTTRVSRFAFETIHQNVRQEGLSIQIKVWLGRRVGLTVTDRLELPALQRSLRMALDIARHAPATSLALERTAHDEQLTTTDYDAPTATVSPAQTVKHLKHLFRICRGIGAQLAGSLMSGEEETAVVNSHGVACYQAATICGAKLVTMYRQLSGYASGAHRRIDRLALDDLLERALAQCLTRQTPVTLPVGTYAVILEPEAIADLMVWLGYIAFGAKSFEERTSFLSGRMGEQVMAKRVTLYDDGTDPLGLATPFDVEGVPTQRVLLIDKGRAAGLVYDTVYGHRYDHPSTGHALSLQDIDGPLPSHLFLEAGDTPVAALIKACDRAILIPRFHYVNGLLNPREALMTGLTREGAWLIEGGKRKTPMTTMRFTQSILEAMRHVVAISRERRLVADPSTEGGCAVMPTIHLAKFRFTGRSDT